MRLHTNALRCQRATTLIQLMIVMAILAILVTTLLVGIAAVRRSARVTQSHSNIEALDIGLSNFKKLTGDYPPSRSDNPSGGVTSPYLDVQQNSQPDNAGDTLLPPSLPNGPDTDVGNARPIERPRPFSPPIIQTNGAQLLVWALAGADLLGSAGFKDLDRDGYWWDDMHSHAGGLYELDAEQRHPVHRRTGPLFEVSERSFVQSIYSVTRIKPSDERFRPLFIDGFGYPVLYYKADRYANAMTTTEASRGVYTQSDNAQITGSGASPGGLGVDLGAGGRHQLNQYIQIPSNSPDTFVVEEARINPDPNKTQLADPLYQDTFARFIWNDRITVRNEPVNKDSFILIGAGEDALYGTADDITNFER